MLGSKRMLLELLRSSQARVCNMIRNHSRHGSRFPIASGAASDPYWANVSMLLHGDGTNAAQNNTFLDGSTNNFTVTRNGNTTQGSFNPFVSTYPYAVATNGGSGYFDGTGDYLSIPSTSALIFPASGSFTVECWVYLRATGVDQIMISSGIGNGLNDWSSDYSSPISVIGDRQFSAIIPTNGSMSCALDTSGYLWTWGLNFYGQLGDGTDVQRSSPVSVLGGPFLSARYDNFAMHAVDSSSRAWAWGYNTDAQLGDGTLQHRSSPVMVGANLGS